MKKLILITAIFLFSPLISHAADSINILSVKDIANGKEVLITATDEFGDTVGFGDGTVHIERVRIYNPPRYLVVPEGTPGSILHSGTDGLTGKIKRWFVLDSYTLSLNQAIQDIEKVIRREGSKVELGKVGSTVSTFYASVVGADGQTRRASVNESFATIRAGNGTLGADNDAVIYSFVECNGTNFASIIRSIFTFASMSDTLAGQTITSSTLSLYGDSKDGSPPDWGSNVVGVVPGSQTTVVASDYQLVQREKFSTVIDLAGWNTTTYNNFAFNASGTTWIANGNESFMVTSDQDTDNSAPVCSAGQQSYNGVKAAETAGSTQDPFLTVQHEAASGNPVNATTTVTLGDLLAPLNLLDLIIDALGVSLGVLLIFKLRW